MQKSAKQTQLFSTIRALNMRITCLWRWAMLAAFGFAAWMGCQPPSKPSVRAASHPSQQTESNTNVPIAYSKFADPMFLAYEDETNIYSKVTIARLWVEDTKWDDTGSMQQARQAEAQQVLRQALQAEQELTDPCAGGAFTALGQAETTKKQLEHRYLQVSESQGQDSMQSKRMDGHVHVLRDEIQRLQRLVMPCEKPMFNALPQSGPTSSTTGRKNKTSTALLLSTTQVNMRTTTLS